MTPLALFRPPTESLEARVLALRTALEAGGWRKRADLALRLNWTIRAVRDTASHSQGAILSGPNGLCLTTHATPEEIEHSRLILLSQARQMIRRALELDAWLGTPAEPAIAQR